MTAREVLDGIKARTEGLTDLCPEHLRQSIRHVQRNCDIECNTHEDESTWDDCKQPDRYDGERMAGALADVARLVAAVEAVLGLAYKWRVDFPSKARDIEAAIEAALKEGK